MTSSKKSETFSPIVPDADEQGFGASATDGSLKLRCSETGSDAALSLEQLTGVEDLGVVVMSIMRKGLIDANDIGGGSPKISGSYSSNKSRRTKVTVMGTRSEVGFVPGDPAVVIRLFAKNEDGSENVLPFVEFIEPHLVDEFVKQVLETRDEAAKHKDDPMPVQEFTTNADDDSEFDDGDDDEDDAFVATSFIVRVCPDHCDIELIPQRKVASVGDFPFGEVLRVKPEQVHGLTKLLETARDDASRGHRTVVYATQHFE